MFNMEPDDSWFRPESGKYSKSSNPSHRKYVTIGAFMTVGDLSQYYINHNQPITLDTFVNQKHNPYFSLSTLW